MLLNATDIMKILGISKSSAYRTIDDLNKKLDKLGYCTVRGKISKKFFYENYYLTRKEDNHVSLQR